MTEVHIDTSLKINTDTCQTDILPIPIQCDLILTDTDTDTYLMIITNTNTDTIHTDTTY